VTYAYDLDGFLTTKTDGSDVTSYTYSSRGELLNVTLPDNTVIEYIHDPIGRRITKKVDGAITEKYLWQGLTRLLAVYDGSDNLLMRFEYADSRMPVAMTSGGATYYLTYDQVGSLKAVANSSGIVVKSLTYDSFGNIIGDTNPTFELPFGFAGGLHDRDTGLVRFGYRDYDPNVGRWTAKDPISFAGGDTDLYGYVQNNPLNFVDPWGLYWEYSQSTGDLYYVDPDNGIRSWSGKGYSGSPCGDGLNNPDAEDIKDVGPIPRGIYTIGTPYKHPKKGPVTMELDPGQTLISNRDQFLIHGDSTKYPNSYSASEGCIVLDRFIREEIANSGDNELRVVK